MRKKNGNASFAVKRGPTFPEFLGPGGEASHTGLFQAEELLAEGLGWQPNNKDEAGPGSGYILEGGIT